jgi:hypothetical protein
LNSIHRAAPGSQLVSAANSATNLTGESKAIPPWENQDNRFDVSDNDDVSPLDLLQVINELITNDIHDLPAPSPGNGPPPFVDVSGDNRVAPLDAIQVINELIAAQSMLTSEPQVARGAMAAVAVPEPTGLALAAGGCLLGAAPLVRRRRGKATRYGPARSAKALG